MKIQKFAGKIVKNMGDISLVAVHIFGKMSIKCGVSWPSGLAYRTQVLVLAAECGFESRP